MVPFLSVKLTNTPLDWNFTTTPQAGLSGRVIPFARGHGLGGSSTISENFAPLKCTIIFALGLPDVMAYTRGSNDTWNRYATLTKDDSWAWKNVEQFYLKVGA